MRTPVIRIATDLDGPAIAELRRTWTAEEHGEVADEGFEARFLGWDARESDRRISWLAEVCGEAVAMMNLCVYERMPRPGRDAGTWGYLANAFVLGPYRNQGIGGLILDALLAYADDHRYVRVLLRPSARATPFYLGPVSPPTAVSSSATPRSHRARRNQVARMPIVFALCGGGNFQSARRCRADPGDVEPKWSGP